MWLTYRYQWHVLFGAPLLWTQLSVLGVALPSREDVDHSRSISLADFWVSQHAHQEGFLQLPFAHHRHDDGSSLQTTKPKLTKMNAYPGTLAIFVGAIIVITFTISWWCYSNSSHRERGSVLTSGDLEDVMPGSQMSLLESGAMYISRNLSEMLTIRGIRIIAQDELLTKTETGKFDTVNWKTAAESGELDTYTCFALAVGTEGGLGPDSREMLPTLVCLFIMQVIIPILLLVYQTDKFELYSNTTDPIFRTIGFFCYGYSVWRMYHFALDECRTSVLDFGMQEQLSRHFMFPIIYGEFVNSLLSMELTYTLFLIFCSATRVEDLLINCIAINFLGDVDGQFVTDQMRFKAIERFERVVHTLDDRQNNESIHIKAWQLLIRLLCRLMRIAGTLGGGLLLSMLFLFGNSPGICEVMKKYEPFPFCKGVEIQIMG